MTDWTVGIEKRNYGIRRKNEIITRDLLWIVVPFILVAASLVFLLWVRIQITDTGYKIQELALLEESLTRAQEKLTVREGVLQSPERIDQIARGRLGMAPLRPEQVLTPRIQSVPADRSVMAMAGGDQ